MISFSNTYDKLPSHFHNKSAAASFPDPSLIVCNTGLAQELGLNPGDCQETLCRILSGQQIPEGAAMISMAYAGHQFGHFVPSLGDGRALLLGEVVSPEGQRFDIQLKGSGPTAYSRRGDGLSALGPVLREYLISEAMHSLGVPATRALAAIATGGTVSREYQLPGGVFARVASSHIRTGTFQYFASRNDQKALTELLHYTVSRHFPDLQGESDLSLAFLKKVAEKQADMITDWLSYGFIHGVMNTDNMAVSGQTLDFGPCAFMDHFSKNRVFSSIDRSGRYSYGNQINMGLWNLCRLAESLLALIHADRKIAVAKAEECINACVPVYEELKRHKFAQKLGFKTSKPEDELLIELWFNILEKEDLDFTLSFRHLSENPDIVSDSPEYREFLQKRNLRLREQSLTPEEVTRFMNSKNPLYIPRNHHTEKALEDAVNGDFSRFHKLANVLLRPFEKQKEYDEYSIPPLPEERIAATFCGT